MIPTIIFFLLRRYNKRNPEAAAKLRTHIRRTSKCIAILVLLFAISQVAFSQDTKLNYVIKRKGSQVGTMSFTQQSTGNKIFFKVDSEVKTRMIFLFTAKGREESVFENGILISSWIFRKMNGREKANKKLQRIGNDYVITKGTSRETSELGPIHYNMLRMYSYEPSGISKVYSDNFQQFLDIETLGRHHYKVSFPDGNYNEYFYKNGICTRVEIHHSLYSATMELKS
jgi:hypothetical protein